ncbi:MAG: type III pantothenate kinase [Planctomycetes bacterium]|nr:type III pantothenate kinase [Planctomycetota bacterium]
MLLAINAGNTNTVFAISDGDTVRAEWRAETSASRTADEYFIWLVQLMALEGLKPADIDGAIIATVVPQALFSLRQMCSKYFCAAPLVVGDANVDLGIGINLDRPDVVGAGGGSGAVDVVDERTGGAFGTSIWLEPWLRARLLGGAERWDGRGYPAGLHG